MANRLLTASSSFITPGIIAKEALMQLENNMKLGNIVHRDYKKEFVKVGSRVNIRLPNRFTVHSGANITGNIQEVFERNTDLIIEHQDNVAWQFSSQELTLDIEEYSKRYIQPAMSQLANKVDMRLAALAKNLFRYVGTPGTVPGSFADLAAGAQYMDEVCVDQGGTDRYYFANPTSAWTIAAGQSTVFQEEMVKQAIREGYIGKIANYNTVSMQNIDAHTFGTETVVTLTVATTDGDTSLTVNALAGTLKAGDILQCDATNPIPVYDVNPVSKKVLANRLKTFVVTTDALIGATTVYVAPVLYDGTGTGPEGAKTIPYQVMSGPLAIGDTLTVIKAGAGTAYENTFGIHKNCFAMVMVPLAMPESASFKARETYNNISVRVIKDYNILTDNEVIRLDILYGVKAIYPELGLRIYG